MDTDSHNDVYVVESLESRTLLSTSVQLSPIVLKLFYPSFALSSSDSAVLASSAITDSTLTSPTLPPIPAAASNLVAVATSSNSIQLTWSDNSSSESGFIIRRLSGGLGVVTSVAANTTSYTDTGLDPQTQYLYVVVATNAAGSSKPSNPASATTPAPPPVAPTLTTASAFSAARVDLSWKDNSTNEDNFLVEESTDGNTYSTIATLAANTTNYSVTGLTPNTQYTFRIFAKNANGTSSSDALNAMTKQNVTVDGNGWTTILPSADSRMIYVSSSTGNDNNSGLTPDSPVKTISKGFSLLRNGFPDWLLLKAGDTFNQKLSVGKSGRSATEPMVFGSYGTGPRPIIDIPVGLDAADVSYSANYVAIKGIAFTSSQRDPTSPNFNASLTGQTEGLMAVGGTGVDTTGLLIEDCSFTYFKDGIVVEGNNGTWHNVSIRRDIVDNCYSTTTSHSQGMFLSKLDNVLIEQSVFDHNGWNSSVTGADPTIFNHDVYMDSNITGSIMIDGNVFSNASSHGLQARSGGNVENNLFLNDAIGMSFGYANGATIMPGGVSGEISGNVFIGDHDIAGAKRGWAMELSNLKAGGGTTIENNIIEGDTQNNSAAIHLDYGSVYDPQDAVGINDLTIQNNTIDGWYSVLSIKSSALPGGTGQYALNGLVVKNNSFQNISSGMMVDLGPAYVASAESFAGNIYSGSGGISATFTIAGKSTPFAAWQSSVESSSTNASVNYLDANRTVDTYMASLNSTGATLSDFLAQLEARSAQSWDVQFSTDPVIAYIAAGFAKQ